MRQSWRWVAAGLFISAAMRVVAQGPLSPIGAPEPGMRTLEQVEPRIPISRVPTVISNSGAYYFTGNLLCDLSASAAIYVQADNVTIDLCGYTLAGTPTSGGAGIIQDGNRLCVENGAIRGFSGNGIFAGGLGNIIRNLRVSQCAYGISAGPQALIDTCSVSAISNATGNALGIFGDMSSVIRHCTVGNVRGSSLGICRGIQAAAGSVVAQCTVMDVAIADGMGLAHGIYGSGSTITESVAEYCLGVGIYCTRAVIRDCTSRSNYDGFYLTQGARAEHCAAMYNATNGFWVGTDSAVIRCSANNNYLQGIHVDGSQNAIAENACGNNTSSGIFVFGDDNRIEGNHVYANAFGIYLRYWAPDDQADRNLVCRNTVGRNTSENFHHVGNNYVAPLDTTGAFTNPLANYSF